jgi:CubicO group peptidase (beta-lactamase class C family)/membrane protease YdiL (CAAX protease family)
MTWAAWLTAAASSRGVISFEIPLLFIVGGLGPGVAAVFVLRTVDGKAAVDAMWRALLRWRVPVSWAFAAVGLPVLIRVVAAGVDGSFDGLWAWGSAGAPLVTLARYLVQAIPEEVGWRFFALPRLQARHNALVASLILGALWALWHVPLLLTAGGAEATYPKIAYFVDIMASAVLYTWLFNNTKGSVLIAVLFHGVSNTVGTFVIAEAVVITILAAVVVAVFGPRHLSHRNDRVSIVRGAGDRSLRLPAVVTGIVVVVLAGGLVAAPAAVAQSTSAPVDTAAVDAFLDALISRHGVPGLAVAVIDGDEVSYAQGYGRAGPGRPMRAALPMPLGSTTKTFTAVAVLQLVEDGAVELDAPVTAYLPWFRVTDERASHTITVRHLLNHTSGLSDVTYNRVLDGHTSLADGVRDLRHARLAAPVGSTFLYFNGNYSTLALIVETVSRQPFAEYVRDHIGRPLGMAHSSAEGADPSADVAQGHSRLFGFAVPRDAPPYSYMLGAGHLVSTAPDLARLGIALANDGTYGDATILDAASIELMTTAGLDEVPYGMGWQTGTHRGEPIEFHDGAGPTSMSQLVLLPDRDRGYALVMNQEHLVDSMVVLPQLRAGLLDLLLGRSAAPAGTSVRLIGAVLLAMFAVSVGLAVRSLRRLRGWPQRAQTLTARQLTRAIGPHIIVPVAVIIAVYQLSPIMLGNPFNVGWVGRWYAPDILLLLVVSTIPDLLQGLYMFATAVIGRRTSTDISDVTT